MVWWYDGMVVWWYGGMVVWWYGGQQGGFRAGGGYQGSPKWGGGQQQRGGRGFNRGGGRRLPRFSQVGRWPAAERRQRFQP